MNLGKPIESMSVMEILRFIAKIIWHQFGPYYISVTEALTYDDVHLDPKYSDILPGEEISTETEIVKGTRIKTPFISAAMDTVTGFKMAIVMAKNGCVGVLHRNCSIEDQVRDVVHVKRHQSTMVTNPVTLSPDTTIKQALKIYSEVEFGKILIVDANNKLLGLISRDRVQDFSNEPGKLVKDMMIPFEELHVAYDNTNTKDARLKMKETGKKRLPIIKSQTDRTLIGLYFRKDIDNMSKFPNMSVDASGRYLVGAAIGVGEQGYERAVALIAVGVDFLVTDVAQGYSKGVIDIIKRLKKEYPHIPVMGGNVVSAEAAKALIDAGAAAVKVGVGPGKICTTRETTGNGKAQFTAIVEVAQVTKLAGIPLIADGGIKATGDVVKAIAAGASAVMMGGVFSATDEAPGKKIDVDGVLKKEYRGMGSKRAMEVGNALDRYGDISSKKEESDDEAIDKPQKVAEGVSQLIVCRGPVQKYVNEYRDALIQSMWVYQGARTITELQTNPRFTKITFAGQIESGTRV